MDENEPQGGLAQALSASAQPPVASQPLAAAPAAKPEPSEYEKALASYQQQKQQLIEQQRRLVDSLESRVGGSAESLLALSAGFGKHAPSFGEGFGNAMGAYGAQQAKSRQEMSDIAKMKMELGVQQLGMRKDDVELAKTQQLSGALTNLLSGRSSPEASAASGFTREQASLIAGMPSEYKAIIIAQMQTGDVKGAIQELQKYMHEQTKEPEKIKELRYYMSQLQSPAAKSIAQQLAANNYFLGSPAERNKTILDIQKAMDQEIISRRDGNILIQGMTNIGGGQSGVPSTGADNVYRTTKPTEQEAAAAAINANAAGIPFSISVQPSASLAAAPEATGEPLTQRQRDLEKLKQEEAIKAKSASATKVYEKIANAYEAAEASATSAMSTINSMDQILRLSPNAASGQLQPMITGVKNVLTSLGISSDSLVNEQLIANAIDRTLIGKMEAMGSAARGLTDRDMISLKNSLPKLDTDKAAREEVARIVKKSKVYDIENYRMLRLNESKNFPIQAAVRPVPSFYVQWIEKSGGAKKLKDMVSSAKTEEEKLNAINMFDKLYGTGVSEQILR